MAIRGRGFSRVPVRSRGRINDKGDFLEEMTFDPSFKSEQKLRGHRRVGQGERRKHARQKGKEWR